MRRREQSMEERFLAPKPAKEPSSLLADIRGFARLIAVAALAAAAAGIAIGAATGHGVLAGATWGLWIAGAGGVVFGGSGGAHMNSCVAVRQRSGRGLLAGQIDPLALIVVGFALLGIGVPIAVVA